MVPGSGARDRHHLARPSVQPTGGEKDSAQRNLFVHRSGDVSALVRQKQGNAGIVQHVLRRTAEDELPCP